MAFVMLLPDSFRIANRKLYPARVSVRFVIPCSWLHFDALLQTAKPVRLQENASCCAQVRARSMRLRVSGSRTLHALRGIKHNTYKSAN